MARVSVFSLALIACSSIGLGPAIGSDPLVVWNASPSVPVGLYWIERRQPALGDIVVLRLPDGASILANERRYLPTTAVLLKQVFAREGDVVCRFGIHVFINGKLAAAALVRDKMERPMPFWKGCLKLSPSQIFVLSKRKDSFDSRYFGAIEKRQVLGTGRLIFPVR
jgi:conjugative transfer signal peptidase TraF